MRQRRAQAMSPSCDTQPRRRASAACGATLVELSLVVTVLALFFALDLQSRREDRLFYLADLAAAELNEIVSASLSYRTNTGKWPLDHCAEDYLLPPSPPSPLSSNCDGDSGGLIDENDLSGVRRLFREGYIPLSDWRTELSSTDAPMGGSRALSLNSVLGGRLLLQPVPTTGTTSWTLLPTGMSYAALATSIDSPAELDALVSRQGLRLWMALPVPFACMARYISGLVPSSRVLVDGTPIVDGMPLAGMRTIAGVQTASCPQAGNVSVEILRRNAPYTRSEDALVAGGVDTDVELGTVLRVERLIIGDNVSLDAPGNRIFFEAENTYSPYYGVLRLAPYGLSSTEATTVETAIQFARSSVDTTAPSGGLAVLAARPGGGPQATECCVEHYRLVPGDSTSPASGIDYFPFGVAPYSPLDRNWQNNVLIMRPGARADLATNTELELQDANTREIALSLEMLSKYRQYPSSIDAGQRAFGQPQGLTYHGARSVSGRASGVAFAVPRDSVQTDIELVIGGLPVASGANQGLRHRSAFDLYNNPAVLMGPSTLLRYDHSYVANLFLGDTDLILGYGPRYWRWDPLGYRDAATPYQTALDTPPDTIWLDEDYGLINFQHSFTNIYFQRPTRLLGVDFIDTGYASLHLNDSIPLKIGRENSGSSATHTLASDAIIEGRNITDLSCLQCTDSTRCPADASATAC